VEDDGAVVPALDNVLWLVFEEISRAAWHGPPQEASTRVVASECGEKRAAECPKRGQRRISVLSAEQECLDSADGNSTLTPCPRPIKKAARLRAASRETPGGKPGDDTAPARGVSKPHAATAISRRSSLAHKDKRCVAAKKIISRSNRPAGRKLRPVAPHKGCLIPDAQGLES
jgi:hypothetical protein